MPIPFPKPWLDFAGQIALLKQRGLAVPDEPAAAWFLGHVNYYRLAGYCLAFEHRGRRHTFVPGTTFAHLKAAYDFDFNLRDLVNEALEIIEVDLRTAVAHHFGQTYGAFGHASAASFHQSQQNRTFQHWRWLHKLRETTDQSKEVFAQHFRQTYAEFPDLPVWVATEVMSFGALSLMIGGMHNADQQAVADRYGVSAPVLASWVHHLVYVRNLCAHHARLWDRVLSVVPQLPAGPGWQRPHLGNNRRLAATLLILYTLVRRCLDSPAPDPFPGLWRGRVNALLAALPAAPNASDKLGLTPGWSAGPAWQ